MPLGNHFDVQVTRIGGGAAYGVIKVKLFLMALACELAQPAQCHLDVAGAQFLAVVIVFVGALIPDLHRTFIASLVLPDANALGVLTIGAKRAGAAGANPFAAAFVALFLFLKAFFEGFHELVPAHFFNLGPLLRAQVEFQVFA